MKYFIYDGACAICVKFRNIVVSLDKTIIALSFDDPALSTLPLPFSSQTLRQGFHVVENDGHIYTGEAAIPCIVRLIPVVGWLCAWALEHVPGAQRLNASVYRWVALHRK